MCQSCDSSVVQNELAQRLSVQTHTSTFELVQLIDSSVTDRYTRVLYTRTAPGPVLVLPQCKCHCIDDVIGRLPHSPSTIVENCNSDVLPIVVQFWQRGTAGLLFGLTCWHSRAMFTLWCGSVVHAHDSEGLSIVEIHGVRVG